LQDSDVLTTPIQRAVDLQVSAAAEGSFAKVGGTLVYTINVGNTEVSDATGVVLTEKLPVGTVFNSAESSPGWIETTPGTFTLSLVPLPVTANWIAIHFTRCVQRPHQRVKED
jgi:uncharacterized repeat protein (TIGR01451 family)